MNHIGRPNLDRFPHPPDDGPSDTACQLSAICDDFAKRIEALQAEARQYDIGYHADVDGPLEDAAHAFRVEADGLIGNNIKRPWPKI